MICVNGDLAQLPVVALAARRYPGMPLQIGGHAQLEVDTGGAIANAVRPASSLAKLSIVPSSICHEFFWEWPIGHPGAHRLRE